MTLRETRARLKRRKAQLKASPHLYHELRDVVRAMRKVALATVEELTRLGKMDDLAELRAGGWLNILDDDAA